MTTAVREALVSSKSLLGMALATITLQDDVKRLTGVIEPNFLDQLTEAYKAVFYEAFDRALGWIIYPDQIPDIVRDVTVLYLLFGMAFARAVWSTYRSIQVDVENHRKEYFPPTPLIIFRHPLFDWKIHLKHIIVYVLAWPIWMPYLLRNPILIVNYKGSETRERHELVARAKASSKVLIKFDMIEVRHDVTILLGIQLLGTFIASFAIVFSGWLVS
ncbi:hypothetical protein [Tateyamaria sp.]|uniref:hypothetical protein n=1 Tax=Tateyamaria sp. TaxID=1929288 RepID=UPI0032A0047A